MNPSSKDAYRRVMVLKYLVSHAYRSNVVHHMYQNSEHWTEKEKNEFETECNRDRDDTISSLVHFDLWEYVTPSEKNFFSFSLPKITDAMQINISWRMEAAAAIIWALKLVDNFPDINMQANTELLKLVEIKKIDSSFNGSQLRAVEEIARMRNIIELWHWRVNTRRLIKDNFDFQPTEILRDRGISSLNDIVKMTANHAFKNGELAEIMEDDFVFKGQPFRSLTNEDFDEVASIIIERHHALNWLCGYAPENDWDETPTGT